MDNDLTIETLVRDTVLMFLDPEIDYQSVVENLEFNLDIDDEEVHREVYEKANAELTRVYRAYEKGTI